jgi:hypothetical protein
MPFEKKYIKNLIAKEFVKIALLVWYKAGNVFEQWEDGMLVTISVTSMNAYLRFFCICVVLFKKNILRGANTLAKVPPVTRDS